MFDHSSSLWIYAMRLSIRQLRYICEIAHRGSISRAAQELSISQSSILAALELGEAELGARIFDRRPSRGMVLTPAGEGFIVAARAMLNAAAEFDAAINNQRRSMPKVLRVGCFEPFGALFMPEVLRRFFDMAGHDIEIDLHEGDQNRLREWLIAGQIEFAVTYNLGDIGTGSFTRICDVPPHALLHVDDPLARQGAVTVQALSEKPMILLDMPQTVSYLVKIFDNVLVRPKVRLHTRSYETIRAAVASGFGMSVLNMRPLGGESQDGPRIVRRPILDDLPPAPLIVADMFGGLKPPHVALFIEVMRSFFRSIGPGAFAVTLPEREAGLMK